MTNIKKPIISNETGQAIRAAIKEAASDIVDKITNYEGKSTKIYGFHIDANDADPYNAVTYLKDAVGMTPARMNYLNNTFAYGSWGDAFFMPRPCMVKYDGTVDYYLDPNDYDKKENGDVSAIGDPNTGYGIKYQGNAMMEWGTNNQQIWTKILPDADDPYSGSVYISNKKVDENYVAWPFINNQGDLVEHFYTPIYNGSLTAYKYNSTTYYRLRSIPRRIVMNSPGNNSYDIPWDDDTEDPNPTAAIVTDVLAEWFLACNNNPNINWTSYPTNGLSNNRESIGWFTEVYADIQLINNLLILIGKSLNTQEVFGNGNMNGYNSPVGKYTVNNGILYTGSHSYDDNMTPQYNVLNKAGLFWGSNSDKQAVKVFGMENWWGNQWRRYAGHIGSSSGYHFVKNTFGTEDGSTGIGYNTSSTRYINTMCFTPDIYSTIQGYIKSCKFINSVTIGNKLCRIAGFLPNINGGTSSQYYSDASLCYSNNSYALRGGSSGDGFNCGAFCIELFLASNYGSDDYGAALSFKPIS